MVERNCDTYGLKGAAFFIIVFLWMVFLPGTVLAESGVFDKAGLFSHSETIQLEALARELENEYKMNFLVLTTDEAYGMSSAEAAEAFYEENGYDTNERNGGIVLLIDMDNREMNLVTNGDMIYYITDSREERIYDAGEEYIRDGEYGKTMYAMLHQVQVYMEKGIPDNQYTYDAETGKIIRHHGITSGEWLLALAAALFTAAAVCLVLYRKYTVVPKYEYRIGQNAGMNLTGKEDRLVNQFVTRRRIPKNPTGNGGGSTGGGGRTSTHTSSGGGSFGGGHGRGF